jgi:hypothetical protein
VGGTKTCAEYNPEAKAIAKTNILIPDFLLSALFKEDRMTKPESQYTGMEIMRPAKFKASGDLFRPTNFKIALANTFVPPVLSKKVPITVPKAMTKPMLERVFPKPSPMVFMIVSGDNPNNRPDTIAAALSENTGCTLNLTVATIMPKITAKRRISSIGLKKLAFLLEYV